jgi:hypothetical protein
MATEYIDSFTPCKTIEDVITDLTVLHARIAKMEKELHKLRKDSDTAVMQYSLTITPHTNIA